MIVVHGMDVSRWQGTINWARCDCDFAFIKATGGDGGLYTDGMFATNAKACTKPWGPYHFCSGTGDPIAEAAYFASRIASTSHQLPPVADWEVTWSGGALNNGRANAWLLPFVEEVERRLGRRPLIYTGAYVPLDRSDHRLLRYELWLAAYTASPIKCSPWSGPSIWQYTSTGACPGIAGHVDRNYSDRAWLDAQTGPMSDVGGTTSLLTEDGMPKQVKFPDGVTYVLVPCAITDLAPHGWGWHWLDGPQTESDAFYVGAISRQIINLSVAGSADFDAAWNRYPVLNGPKARDH